MNAPVWVWALAWVGSAVLAAVLGGEVWIRLRDNARGDGIDLDAEDSRFRPGPDALRVITETSTGDGEDVVRRWVQRGDDRPERKNWLEKP